MNTYSPYRRLSKASVVCVSLVAVYWLYRLTTSTFLEVERNAPREIAQPRLSVAEFKVDAARWFPEKSWVPQAGKHFRHEGRYLFCNRFDLNAARSRIDASPVAILWRSEPDEIPVRLTADAARLSSDSRLLSENTELGEITSVELNGNVVIRGPDNLLIKGHSFRLDQESMKLWSGEPVTFQWQTHSGLARQGVEIQLQAEQEEGGLMAISAVSKIQLLGRVDCHVVIPPSRRGDESVELKITAPNGFDYDVPFRTARFSGRPTSDPNHPLKLQDEVNVDRIHPEGGADKLVCPELVLQFRDRLDQNGTPNGQLQLSVIQAWGRKIFFVSPANDLKMLANRLWYYVEERRLEIETAAVHGRNDMLRIRQNGTDLTLPPSESGDGPQIQVQHDASGTVQQVTFTVPASRRRPGERLGTITSDGRPPAQNGDESSADMRLAVEWGESLTLRLAPDGLTRIVRLTGGARVAEEEREFALTAQQIAMRLLSAETDPQVRATDTGRTRVSRPPLDGDAGTGQDFDLGHMVPQVLVAMGDVALASAEGDGTLREKLTVNFEQIDEAVVSQENDPFRTVSQSETDAAGNAETEEDDSAPTERFTFVSNTLNARVQIGSNRKLQFRDLWLNGDVEITREADDDESRFTATGNQLVASGGLSDDRTIQLFGDPARVIRPNGQSQLEGTRIDLKEVSRRATVVGNGSIRFMTDKGVDGRKLPAPAPIDIYWSDHMEFRDKSANFVGNIRVTMVDAGEQTVELRCAGLTVHFSDDVSLGSRGEDGGFSTIMADDTGSRQNGRIERIECHNAVTVKIEQFVDGVLNARHSASFADLDANLETGLFSAVGPGTLESVSPDRDGQLQGAPPVTARANAAAQTTETAFVSVQVDFIGELRGNLHHKEAELTHNVVALVTPAWHVDEKVDLQVVSTENLPTRAGILRAHRLTIDGLDRSPTGQTAFSLVARQNARLESRNLKANADIIVYDHAKQQFIIQAEGDGRVAVSHRTGPDGKFNRFHGKRFEYYRRTKELRSDRINGLDVTQ